MRQGALIGDKRFYKATLAVALPIMIQNFITNLVSMLDNLMLGAVGTEQMSGVSIVNQLLFIVYLAGFGALGGAGIFTAQFHGKKDDDGVRSTFRYKLLIMAAILVLSTAVLLLFGDGLISLYLHEADAQGDLAATRMYAKQYLMLILIGLAPYALSQAVSSTLRETGETMAPMVASFAAVGTNCLFNYILIFGKLGVPALGVRGAAIATVISRYIECIWVVVYALRHRGRFTYFKGALRSMHIPKALAAEITVKGMPLLLNEFFWSTGMSLLSVGYSLHGIDVVAGVSISTTVMNLANISFLSLGSSIGIIVGKQLGAEKFDEAVDTYRKMMAFCIAVSAVISAVVLTLGGRIPGLYRTNEASKAYAAYFIRASGCFLPAVSISNAAYFTLRSGGKTWITILFDSVFMMCVSVPTVFGLYALHLNVHTIYPIVQSLECIKALIGILLLRRRVWVNNIVN